jgi:hypothetical protein
MGYGLAFGGSVSPASLLGLLGPASQQVGLSRALGVPRLHVRYAVARRHVVAQAQARSSPCPVRSGASEDPLKSKKPSVREKSGATCCPGTAWYRSLSAHLFVT